MSLGSGSYFDDLRSQQPPKEVESWIIVTTGPLLRYWHWTDKHICVSSMGHEWA